MASKKDDEKVDKEKLMDVVRDYCSSNEFEAEFEAFAKEHSDVFVKFLDFTDNTGEHPLEFHDVYRQYLSKFEGMIEKCIEKVREAHYTAALGQ
jgi:hypothetical protein